MILKYTMHVPRESMSIECTYAAYTEKCSFQRACRKSTFCNFQSYTSIYIYPSCSSSVRANMHTTRSSVCVYMWAHVHMRLCVIQNTRPSKADNESAVVMLVFGRTICSLSGLCFPFSRRKYPVDVCSAGALYEHASSK